MARCDRKHAKGTRFPTFETREIAEHYQNLRSVITYDLIHGSDFFFSIRGHSKWKTKHRSSPLTLT